MILENFLNHISNIYKNLKLYNNKYYNQELEKRNIKI